MGIVNVLDHMGHPEAAERLCAKVFAGQSEVDSLQNSHVARCDLK